MKKCFGFPTVKSSPSENSRIAEARIAYEKKLLENEKEKGKRKSENQIPETIAEESFLETLTEGTEESFFETVTDSPGCPPGTPVHPVSSIVTSVTEDGSQNSSTSVVEDGVQSLPRNSQCVSDVVVVQMPNDGSYRLDRSDSINSEETVTSEAWKARLGMVEKAYNKDEESDNWPPDMFMPKDSSAIFKRWGSELSENVGSVYLNRTESTVENKTVTIPVRKVHHYTLVVFCITMGIIFILLGMDTYTIISRSIKDHRWIRFWKIVFYPWIVFVMYFAVHVMMTNIFSSLGPVAHTYRNSKYYSANPTPPLKGPLPNVTVQIPVYKESFSITLKPTLLSVLDACWQYEEQGGRANIVMYDDGMLLISSSERRERRSFYKKHNIAYVARPGRGRKGRFKKASNLNFGMNLSLEVDSRVAESNGSKSRYEALREIQEESMNVFRAAGDIRLGEFLVLIDSDTRIPQDCFLPLVSEMRAYPEVAFIQSLTHPLQQIHDYWENAISHFTRMVYSVAILVACSGGDPAPLVGHNVCLRWSAMKEVAVPNMEEQQYKFWSEDCVSEDFDYSMRVQAEGYIGRYATYANDFKEGVSLTVHDEITRFRKYAFGAAEMLINPIAKWGKEGVISKVFLRYMCTKSVPIQARFTLLGYLGTYFAIASAPLAALFNYFAYRYFPIYREESVPGIDIMAVTFIIFFGIAPLGICITKYRLGLRWSLFEEYQPSIIYLIFFSGIGYHLLIAICCHILSVNMTFGITKKEVEQTNFFKEVKSTVKAYWVVYLWVILGTILVLGLFFAPPPFQIRSLFSIFPFAWTLFFHFFAPIILNPVLMLFKY